MPTEPTDNTSSRFVDIRPFMATFPTGVGIVTAMGADGYPWGMTCTSICSVTLHPPTILICLRRGSPTLGAALTSGTFALNLLHDRACSAAKLFASGQQDRFSRVTWHMDYPCKGPHLVEVAHFIADCLVMRTETIGDHTVVFGEVCRVIQQDEARPLLYGLRCYVHWPLPAIE